MNTYRLTSSKKIAARQ